MPSFTGFGTSASPPSSFTAVFTTFAMVSVPTRMTRNSPVKAPLIFVAVSSPMMSLLVA